MLLLLFVPPNTLAWHGSMHPILRLLCSAQFFPIGVLEYLDEEQVMMYDVAYSRIIAFHRQSLVIAYPRRIALGSADVLDSRDIRQ